MSTHRRLTRAKQSGTQSSDTQRAMQVKALCTILVKLANQNVEQLLKDAKIDLNVGTLVPLLMLQRQALTVQDLSERLIVSPATLIPIIDELELKGYILRKQDESDRRKKMIHITTHARRVLADAVAHVTSRTTLIDAMHILNSKEQATLISLLEKMLTRMSGSSRFVQIINDTTATACTKLPIAQNEVTIR